MRYFLLAFFATIAIALAVSADARTVTDYRLVWDAPTTREGGAPLPAAELGGYELETIKPGTTTPTITDIAATTTSRNINADPGGTTYRLRAYDDHGTPGAWSEAVKRPFAPGVVKVRIGT